MIQSQSESLPSPSSPSPSCTECGKSFSTPQGVTMHHYRVHGKGASGASPSPIGIYECPDCSSHFETKHGLRMHRAKMHGVHSLRRQNRLSSNQLTFTEVPGFKVIRDSNGDIWLAEKWGESHG